MLISKEYRAVLDNNRLNPKEVGLRSWHLLVVLKRDLDLHRVVDLEEWGWVWEWDQECHRLRVMILIFLTRSLNNSLI